MERDDESWRQICYHRMESLKSKELWSSEDPASQAQPRPRLPLQKETFGEKNSVIFELQEAIRYGNVYTFVDVLEQLCSEGRLLLSAIFDQVTRTGDSLLHEAAYSGKPNIAELIGHHFPQLLTNTNNKGDTPLHVAARVKSSAVISAILSAHAHESTSCWEDTDGKLTRLTNAYGNTALHEAVSSQHVEGVLLLFEADKCVAHSQNQFGESPLYLAILSPDKQMVHILLEAPFPDDRPLPECRGISPLHAAIYRRKGALIAKILEEKPDMMNLRDEDGGTPLHYAAYIGYVEGVHILLNNSEQRNSSNRIALGSRKTNNSGLSALEWNANGELPIHLACRKGHLKVVQELLKQNWLDGFGVLVNEKGQNILHVAAENGRVNVVNYILRTTKLDINEKDINGNTPLHLASKNCLPYILWSLTRDKRVDVNLKNNKGFTAKDILTRQIDPEVPEAMRALVVSVWMLDSVGARTSDKIKASSSAGSGTMPLKLEWMKDRVNTLMLVTILIVTVTFAAGFTVPGGVYGADDPDPHKRGMAVMAAKERSMDQVQISVEGNEAASWRQRCYDKLKSLQAQDFPSNGQDPASQPRLLQEEPFGEKNCEVFELQKVIQKGNVDKFVEVLEKLCWKKKLLLSDIFVQVTPANDSLLHETAYFGRAEIAELIGHHFPKLLTKTNIDGDTPLHVSARSKNPNVVKLILSQYDAYVAQQSTSTEIITRLTNECGNTALHEAVSGKHVEGVTLLFEADKCVAHYLNKSGQSPLYLAVLTSKKEIVDILLEAPFPDDRPHPKHQGNSPLHVV